MIRTSDKIAHESRTDADDGDATIACPPTLWRLLSRPETFTVEERHRLEIEIFGCIQDEDDDATSDQ